MYFLYSLATLLAAILLSPYFLYQALRHHKYVGSFRQRLGYLPVSFNLDAEESIWVHAVSVGEVLAARPTKEFEEKYGGANFNAGQWIGRAYVDQKRALEMRRRK